MDIDAFSEMAYAIIVHASQVCDTLKTELGVLSYDSKNEDEWLHSIQDCCQDIMTDPDGYVDFWNLEEVESVTAAQIRGLALELSRKAGDVLATPMSRRGKREW